MSIWTILFICVIVIALIIFLLDVFGPTHSQSTFWITIHKLRGGLDFINYWFMNLCAIGAILVVVIIVVRHFI